MSLQNSPESCMMHCIVLYSDLTLVFTHGIQLSAVCNASGYYKWWNLLENQVKILIFYYLFILNRTFPALLWITFELVKNNNTKAWCLYLNYWTGCWLLCYYFFLNFYQCFHYVSISFFFFKALKAAFVSHWPLSYWILLISLWAECLADANATVSNFSRAIN